MGGVRASRGFLHEIAPVHFEKYDELIEFYVSSVAFGRNQVRAVTMFPMHDHVPGVRLLFEGTIHEPEVSTYLRQNFCAFGKNWDCNEKSEIISRFFGVLNQNRRD